MNWFKTSDLDVANTVQTKNSDATCTPITGLNKFASGEDLKLIRNTIGELTPNSSVFFMTNGAWSNINILEYILELTGPADVFFSTWSISADAIRKFTSWKEAGTIRNVSAVMDIGIRNRKPELYQQAIAAFTTLKFSKCHAKVAVIIGDVGAYTIMGSANLTRNPRREVGIITTDLSIALSNAQWIKEEVNNAA